MSDLLTITYETEGYVSQEFGDSYLPKKLSLELDTSEAAWPNILEEFIGFLQTAGWPMGFQPYEIRNIVYDHHRESLRKKVRSRGEQQMPGMREDEGSDHEMDLF